MSHCHIARWAILIPRELHAVQRVAESVAQTLAMRSRGALRIVARGKLRVPLVHAAPRQTPRAKSPRMRLHILLHILPAERRRPLETRGRIALAAARASTSPITRAPTGPITICCIVPPARTTRASRGQGRGIVTEFRPQPNATERACSSAAP